MTEINSRRTALLIKKKKACKEAMLIGYLVAGDPNMESSLRAIQGAVNAGIDIIEVGVPSTQPFLDGEIIQRSHGRAIAKNNNLPIEYWVELRKRIDVPIWAMGYKDSLIDTKLYLKLSEEKLIHGLVLPDCTEKELCSIANEIKCYGVDVIRFANARMDDEEMKLAVEGASLIYAQLYKGTTGDPSAKFDDANILYERIRKFTDAACVAGFGISTPEKVRSIVDSGFDGAVIGSALVARLESRDMDSLYKLIFDMKKEINKENNK